MGEEVEEEAMQVGKKTDIQTKKLIMVGNQKLLHGASMRVPFSLSEHRDTVQCVLLLAIKINWSKPYLIFVRNARNAVSVNFLAECKKFQKNKKITVLGKYVVNLRTFRV